MIQDLKYSLRLLLKDRSFTITALLTLTLCIAANTAMFSIVRSVVLKPLPWPGSERIVYMFNSYPGAGAPRVGTAARHPQLEARPQLQDALHQHCADRIVLDVEHHTRRHARLLSARRDAAPPAWTGGKEGGCASGRSFELL